MSAAKDTVGTCIDCGARTEAWANDGRAPIRCDTCVMARIMARIKGRP